MKYVVLSVNNNPDYTYFKPLTQWAWNKFGWETIMIDYLPEPGDKYRSDTMAQVSRLFAASFDFVKPSDYLLTGDIDMIPLSDYWRPDESKITCYGHDLTGYGHYPICYIGMNALNWMRVMRIDKNLNLTQLIEKELDQMPQAKDPDFYKYWFCDQDLATERLKKFEREIVSIERGKYPNGYAVGRVDRGNWSLKHDRFIDAHLHHQVYHRNNHWKFEAILELLYTVWPEEDFTWFIDYHYQFKRDQLS